MDKNDDLQFANSDIYDLPPEKVIELSMNELKNPVNSINGCIAILEKTILPQLGLSSRPALERIIQILQSNNNHIEKLRQDNYLYLERHSKA